MRRVFAIATLVALGACMSRSRDETRANREHEEQIRSALAIGMTKAEVQAAAGKTPVANCRGNPRTLETCEMNLWVDSSGAPFPFATDYTKNKYSLYTLTFQKGKLTRWDQLENSNYQVDQRPKADSSVGAQDLFGAPTGR